MPDLGPTFPGTGASATNTGNIWLSPGNITAEDGSVASFNASAGNLSDFLRASNFGFSVPSGAIIGGILLEIKRKNTGSAAVDNSVKLMKAGSATGSDKADTVTGYPGSLTYASYGSSSDLWGTTWTDTEVNASGFGAQLVTDGQSKGGEVDAMRITVTYSVASPIGAVWMQQRAVAMGRSLP